MHLFLGSTGMAWHISASMESLAQITAKLGKGDHGSATLLSSTIRLPFVGTFT